MKKKMLTAILVFAMVLTILPVAALAAGPQEVFERPVSADAPAEDVRVAPAATVTVTFDGNGGDVMGLDANGQLANLGEVTSTTVSKTVKLSSYRAVRDGYDFDGWFTVRDGGSKVTGKISVSTDTTFYAHWTVSEVKPVTYSYTVRHEYYGADDKLAYAYEETVTDVEPGTLTAYAEKIEEHQSVKFRDVSGAGVPVNADGLMVVVRYDAVETVNGVEVLAGKVVTINYEQAAGGTVTAESGKVVLDEGKAALAATAEAAEGYSFDGWTVKDGAAVVATFAGETLDEEVELTGGKTYTVIPTFKKGYKYTVTYIYKDLDGEELATRDATLTGTKTSFTAMATCEVDGVRLDFKSAPVVEGAGVELTEDFSAAVTVTYEPIPVTLTVHFVGLPEELAKEDYVVTLISGQIFTVPDVEVAGYTAAAEEALTGALKGDLEFAVNYTAIKTYTLTIYYVYEDSADPVDVYVKAGMYPGDAYEVQSPNYSGRIASRGVVSGVMGEEDVEITVTYSAEVVIVTPPPAEPAAPPAPPSAGGNEEEEPPVVEDLGEEGDTPLDQKPMVFTDVIQGEWYYDSIKRVYAYNWMDGVEDGSTFAPLAKMNRAMMVTVMYRVAGKPVVEAAEVFPDVAENSWYAKAAEWAVTTGVITGYGDGRFGGGDDITREQMAAILYRYAGMPAADEDLADFEDADQISPWAKDAMCWCVETGIIQGKGGILDPKGTATRAEGATMLIRFADLVASDYPLIPTEIKEQMDI